MPTMPAMPSRRFFCTARTLLSHENPLGLPRSGTPPELPRAQRGLPEKRDIRDVRKVVAVSSAKGGVGKSTVAVNLALAFSRHGYRTGILDADIFGPSIPTLMNLSGEPRLSSENLLIPLTNYGVRAMSMGFLASPSTAVAWRGLMVMKALQQLLHSVDWGGLDILLLDMPPGTGDVQLTVTQQVALAGALVVSTPQDVALADARRGIDMFRRVNVDVLGLVQNMSLFACPNCGTCTPIFGRGASTGASTSGSTSGPKSTSEENDENEWKDSDMSSMDRLLHSHGIDLIADIPLDARVCLDADRGKPTVVSEPDSARAKVFMDLAVRVGGKIGL